MNTRLQKICLGFLAILCACLAGFWLQAGTTGKTLQSAITKAQATADEALRSSAEENNRVTALNAEISERQKALGNTPEAQETKRRAAALVIIDQLKLAHEKIPPAPRQKAPPNGSSGIFFSELLSDPEYNRLYAQQNLRTTRIIEGRKLRSLGLSKEVVEQAITILAERDMAFTDYRAVSGKAGIPGDFYRQQMETANRQMEELLGDEMFQRWATLNPEGTNQSTNPKEALTSQARLSVIPRLGTRLSYTETPLTREQSNQLAELMTTLSGSSKTPIYRMLYDDAFIQQSAAILSPPQVEALRQFKAEQDASVKRSKLPKSSELPRNTPRTK